MNKWELLKSAFLGILSCFYTLLFILLVVRVWRGLTTPIDEVEMIDTINKKNQDESLREWEERES